MLWGAIVTLAYNDLEWVGKSWKCKLQTKAGIEHSIYRSIDKKSKYL